MKIKAAIYDIDNTLSDTSRRAHYLDGGSKDWTAFFHACDTDTPILKNINAAKQAAAQGLEILLLTGRTQDTEAKTRHWLAEHGIQYSVLLMRPVDEKIKRDYQLKSEWALELLKKYDIQYAVDDMQHNLDAFAKIGIRGVMA